MNPTGRIGPLSKPGLTSGSLRQRALTLKAEVEASFAKTHRRLEFESIVLSNPTGCKIEQRPYASAGAHLRVELKGEDIQLPLSLPIPSEPHDIYIRPSRPTEGASWQLRLNGVALRESIPLKGKPSRRWLGRVPAIAPGDELILTIQAAEASGVTFLDTIELIHHSIRDQDTKRRANM